MASIDSTGYDTSAALLARCFEIARECLAGDPFRAVPELELEIDRLADDQEGRQRPSSEIGDGAAFGHLPAHMVADNALGLAGELAGALN